MAANDEKSSSQTRSAVLAVSLLIKQKENAWSMMLLKEMKELLNF